AESFAHPGGNVTGLSNFAQELSGKRLEILKETFPKMTRVAVLWSPQEREAAVGFKQTQKAAQGFPLQLQSVALAGAEGIEKVFAEIRKRRPDALVAILHPLVTLHSKRVVEMALKHRLPGMYHETVCRRGGLNGVRSSDRRFISARRNLRRQNPQRCQGGGTSGGGADKVRVGDQSEDSQAARSYNSAVGAFPCG